MKVTATEKIQTQTLSTEVRPLAALDGASNNLIDVEDLTEGEIATLHKHFQTLVQMARKDIKLTQSHSVEEAEARHNVKHSKHRH